MELFEVLLGVSQCLQVDKQYGRRRGALLDQVVDSPQLGLKSERAGGGIMPGEQLRARRLEKPLTAAAGAESTSAIRQAVSSAEQPFRRLMK